MKVAATLWFEAPGACAERQDFDSVHAVRIEFADMVRLHQRNGGAVPTGYIYAPDSDDPSHTVTMGKQGGVVIKRIAP